MRSLSEKRRGRLFDDHPSHQPLETTRDWEWSESGRRGRERAYSGGSRQQRGSERVWLCESAERERGDMISSRKQMRTTIERVDWVLPRTEESYRNRPRIDFMVSPNEMGWLAMSDGGGVSETSQ